MICYNYNDLNMMPNMKKYIFALISHLLILSSGSNVSAASLDDLYRDIIRSDNQGYLPLFVKNRKMPDVLGNDKIASQEIPENTETRQSKEQSSSISLTNPIPQKEAALQAKQLKWEQTLKAVEQNRVTPLELDEIHYRLHQNDPKAVEVLAWMYTKGVGVKIDYVEAYKLYLKAAMLNVPQAQENARLVYQSMNDAQRKKIKGY